MSQVDQQPSTPALGEPYCSNCGHRLTGLVDSSRCPECGKPLVEVLTRRAAQGRRYQSETSLFGLPLVSIATGPTDTETIGKAKGIFAIGDKAKGFVAIGGTAFGIVAIGGRAIGLFACGGLAIGLISSWGGVAIGALASGGLAIGLLAFGGAAIGIMASGGVCIAVYGMGGAPFALHRLGPGVTNQAALNAFRSFAWYFGPINFGFWNFIQPLIAVFSLLFAATGCIGLLAIFRHMQFSARSTRRTFGQPR